MKRNIYTILAFFLVMATWQSGYVDAAVSRLKTWSAAETLTASDLNGEFNNVLDNGEDLGWPATKAKDMDGNSILMDGDQDTHITSDTDDRIDFALSGTDLFRMDGTATTPVNGFDFAATATGSPPQIIAKGSDANITIGVVPKGTGNTILYDGNSNQVLITAAAVTSAVNEIAVTNSATGNPPFFVANGDDTNISLALKPKATGIILLWDKNENEVFKTADGVASAVNEIEVTNAATTNAPQFAATGGDTNIDLNLVSKGTGVVQSNGTTVVPTHGTSQATTSGTAFDFTSLPSWISRITVVLSAVSTDGSQPLIQIGDSGGIEETGYLGTVATISASPTVNLVTTGFQVSDTNADATVWSGSMIITKFENSTLWMAQGQFGSSNAASIGQWAGANQLDTALTQLRLTTVNGTDAFDAGSVNIMYE